MPFEIQGMNFTGFARIDMDKLIQLDYAGRVNWLKHRFELVFLTPFRRLVALDGPDCYIWLCAVSLLCTAVEALADFEFAGRGVQRFSAFIEKYLSSDFKSAGLHLDDPRPDKWQVAATPAQHLYKYFRCPPSRGWCAKLPVRAEPGRKSEVTWSCPTRTRYGFSRGCRTIFRAGPRLEVGNARG
jgi:hypothetical protein